MTTTDYQAKAQELLHRYEAERKRRQQLEETLGKVRDYMRSQEGPLYWAWENGDIANWDEGEWDWPTTLDAIETTEDDLATEPVEHLAIALHRLVVKALGETACP